MNVLPYHLKTRSISHHCLNLSWLFCEVSDDITDLEEKKWRYCEDKDHPYDAHPYHWCVDNVWSAMEGAVHQELAEDFLQLGFLTHIDYQLSNMHQIIHFYENIRTYPCSIQFLSIYSINQISLHCNIWLISKEKRTKPHILMDICKYSSSNCSNNHINIFCLWEPEK